ncbi:hypothetical protein [Polycladidibacter stylochi]|uniref:hypothetical protein n=1 Tax=Polycladidibacter stylochi TaxID=1807766 RepID=UPI00082E8F4E|nr:hypothetical protein [Pseudovibrio stylochi]
MEREQEQEAGSTTYILMGRAWNADALTQEDAHEVNVICRAVDDDDAVTKTLEALSDDGYAEAELAKIGVLTEVPEQEPFVSAYNDAQQGIVAIICFNE